MIEAGDQKRHREPGKIRGIRKRCGFVPATEIQNTPVGEKVIKM